VRSKAIDTPIPAIPLDASPAFLNRYPHCLLGTDSAAPYVWKVRRPELLPALAIAFTLAARSGDTRFGRCPPCNEFVDRNREFLGLEARVLARQGFTCHNGDVLTLLLSQSNEEISHGGPLAGECQPTLFYSFVPTRAGEIRKAGSN